MDHAHDEPGPDIAPYHDRQIVLLRRDQAMSWRTYAAGTDLLVPAPSGTLAVKKVFSA